MEKILELKNLKKHYPILGGVLRREIGAVRKQFSACSSRPAGMFIITARALNLKRRQILPAKKSPASKSSACAADCRWFFRIRQPRWIPAC
jgi:hypothetical protein